MIAYFDLAAGFSGDICLSCLVDAGWEIGALQHVIDGLKLGEACHVEASRVMRRGISATHVDVRVPHSHTHRHLGDIARIVAGAELSELTKKRAMAVFGRLAAAEAKVHGVSVEKVHFHEVGALDAIIDIVGSCAGIEALGIEEIFASGLPMGWGWIEAEHGKIPIPAPATLELLAAANAPTRPSPGGGELVTPTGAALIAELAKFRQPMMRMVRVGNGTGKRDPEWPNVARLVLGEREEDGAIVEIATNIDDMNPQLYAPVMEKVLAAGALDIWLTAVQMKKGRPGTVMQVLAKGADEQRLAGILLKETTTLGVRVHGVRRYEAQREFRRVKTEFGEVTVKLKVLEGKVAGAMPEFDDVRRVAEEKGVSTAEVMGKVLQAAQSLY